MILNTGIGPIDVEAQLFDLDRADAEASLAEFVRQAWHVIEPGQPYVHGWHLDFLAEHLEAITDGVEVDGKPYNRLLVNIPPGTMKSLLLNVFWPAWEWGPRDMPHLRYVCAAHKVENLSARDSRRMRVLVSSPWYQERWGDRVSLSRDQNEKLNFNNNAGGFRIATSITSLTGIRGDRILLDDPHSVDSAGSETQREAEVTTFLEAIPTRLNNPISSAIVVIMQRLHEEDVSGVILEKGLGYDHICYDDETEILTKSGWVKFPDLQDGEPVLGVSPGGLKAVWEVPTEYVRKAYSGEMISYKSQTADLMVTPDHRMIYCDSNDMRGGIAVRWRVRYAKDMPSDFYLPQVVNWEGSSEPVSFGGRTWDALAFAEFMGWYLAEGCASATRCITRIVQNSDGKHVADIERVLNASPFEWKRYKHTGKAHCWTIWSKDLAVALSPFGDSHHKYAPEALKDLSPECLQAFLIAYAKGDGNFAEINPNKITIGTASKKMADDLHECAVKAGWAASKNTRMQPGGDIFNGYVRPDSIIHRIYIRASKVAGKDRKIASRIGRSHISKIHYDGMIYCVSVPSSGVVVRRNGRVSVSGNCLPMEYDPGRAAPTKLGIEDPRQHEGELLFPARFPRDVVDRDKKAMGSYATAGQFQQSPAPRGGGIVKSSQWQLWEREAFPPFDYIIAALDTAYTEKTENDPSAMTVWGVFSGGEGVAQATQSVGASGKMMGSVERTYSQEHPKVMLMHAWTERLELHDLVEKVRRTMIDMKVDLVLIENKASGHSVAQEIRRVYGHDDFSVQMMDPKGQDKISRLYSIQHLFEGGLIYAPDRSWADMTINQVAQFPKGKHDDLVDTVSMGLRHLRTAGILVLGSEYTAALDQSRMHSGAPPPPLYPA